MEKIKSWVDKHLYTCIFVYLIGHTTLFFLISYFTEPKFHVHCGFDDMVPLCEYFVVPYVSWFVAFAGSLVFFANKDKLNCLRLLFAQLLGSTICCVIYLLFQNAITMTQQTVNDNIFSQLLDLVWTFDNPTNSCPSLHVLTSTAIATVTWYSEYFKNRSLAKWAVIVWMFMICISTMFVKQHSVIDVICGAILGAILPLASKKLIR